MTLADNTANLLLSLPLVPLSTVMKNVDPTRLIALASVHSFSNFINKKCVHQSDGFILDVFSEHIAIEMLGERQFWKMWKADDVITELLSVYEKLTTTFSGSLDTLRIDPKYIPEFFTHPYASKLKLLPNRIRALEISAKSSDDTHQYCIDELLNEAQNLKSLTFNVQSCKITNKNAFKVDHLDIHTASWMTQADLLRVDNKTLHIRENEFNDEDINMFLRRWMSGQMNRLEMAIIETADWSRWDLDTILYGLPIKKFNREVREQRFISTKVIPKWINELGDQHFLEIADKEYGVDLQFAVDFERSDGKLASISWNPYQIVLFIWNDRFPSRFIVSEVEKEIQEKCRKIDHIVEYMKHFNVTEREKKCLEDDILLLRNKIYGKYDLIDMLI
uniref:FBA_2 domain-containing protein n=1 Tax=Caenorhabditis japonica TaxID=281687 RepID=A0A8R1E7X8_CAEJA